MLFAHHHDGGLITMSKVYFVRHQAAGIVTKYPFAEHPSEEQVAAVAKECFQSFGFGHAKTPDAPYWTRVEPFDLLGPTDVPVVEERSLSVAGSPGVGVAAAPQFSVSGTGTITPAGESTEGSN